MWGCLKLAIQMRCVYIIIIIIIYNNDNVLTQAHRMITYVNMRHCSTMNNKVFFQ